MMNIKYLYAIIYWTSTLNSSSDWSQYADIVIPLKLSYTFSLKTPPNHMSKFSQGMH
jgi:hypothetical protein